MTSESDSVPVGVQTHLWSGMLPLGPQLPPNVHVFYSNQVEDLSLGCEVYAYVHLLQLFAPVGQLVEQSANILS